MEHRVERAIDVGYGWTKFSTSNAFIVDAKITIDVQAFQSLPMPVTREAFDLSTSSEYKGMSVLVKLKDSAYLVSDAPTYSADALRVRGSNYSSTEQYEVCMAAAVKAMKVSCLDHLVVGTPVGDYESTKAVLKAKFGKGIDVDGKAVEIRNLHVVAQPVGGLVWHYYSKGLQSQLVQQPRLLVDVGHGTLDWVAVQGLKTNFDRSGSVRLGVSHFVDRVVEEIKGVKGLEDVSFSDQVDQMLLLNKPLPFGDQSFRFEDFQSLIEQIASRGVQHIESSIGDLRMYQSVVLMGGGAPLYKVALGKAFKTTRIEIVDNARFANVRGFQLLAERQAQMKKPFS